PRTSYSISNRPSCETVLSPTAYPSGPPDTISLQRQATPILPVRELPRRTTSTAPPTRTNFSYARASMPVFKEDSQHFRYRPARDNPCYGSSSSRRAPDTFVNGFAPLCTFSGC